MGNHWRYCKAYINQCLGENETEKVEQEKNMQARCDNRYHKINHVKKQCILCGYKAELFKPKPYATRWRSEERRVAYV